MATQAGYAPDAVSSPSPGELERDAPRYEYLQLLRMLRLLGCAPGDATAPRGVRTRPALTLGTDPGEIAAARRLPDGSWSITVNVFGLYGPASPLPVYYTEDLLDEAREGRHATRGLIDLLHQVLYPLLFRAWEKYRIAQRVVEARDQALLQGLQGFAGLLPARPAASAAHARSSSQPPPAPPGLPPLLYLALLQQGPRSAAGLRRLLALGLHPATVHVREHVRRLTPVPQAQRSALGVKHHQLGIDTRVGSHVDDASGTLRVDLEGLDPRHLHRYLPAGAQRPRLEALLALYLRDPLRVDLYLRPREQPRRPGPRLGLGVSPRIGLDAWLGAAAASLPAVFAGSWESRVPCPQRAEPGEPHDA